MSTTSFIITGILFLLFTAIYINSVYRKKKKQNLFLGHLSRLSGSNQENITQYDIWHNSVIGMNNSDAELYFIKNSSDDQTFQKISLSDIRRCRVNEVSRTVSIKESIIKVVERVEVIMTSKVKNKPDTVIEFYNQETDRLEIFGELQLAEKWCKLLNDTVSAPSN
ncbi:MAG: hypothetical protein ACM3P1_12875 [Candidatus Saccharibacteria bacterium]